MFDRLRPLLPSVLDQFVIPGPPSKEARFDAYSRIRDRHGTSAFARASGRLRKHAANDAIDTNMLQHLAEGLVLVTRDYELIEQVDLCGSCQAPWVRTLGEVLCGHLPAGPPFDWSAKRAMSRHRPRRRRDLSELDKRAEEELRAHSAPRPERPNAR